MIDINLIREDIKKVEDNLRKKYQEDKIPLLKEVLNLDKEYRNAKKDGDDLRNLKNQSSDQIGILMRDKKVEEANKVKEMINEYSAKISILEEKEEHLSKQIKEIMMKIPNIVASDVPVGKDDTFNVDSKHFGELITYDYEIPYHTDIMERLSGIDLDSARRISGNGFYFLTGNIARLHSAILSYARDFMINKGFTYCIPPYMIHGDAVNGVMSFEEKENMMYKIEGEDLYLIGTSEHSMIARFKDQLIDEKMLPLTLTSYSPCFRKEVGAHGIEERGVYRIHQFEKQEMVVICKKEESDEWYEKMWNYSVELFRTMDIPVRQLICCTGDLADLKYRSCDIEAWSPRQQKYFEVCSCSNLTDAQSRRLGIRVKDSDGNKYYPHTLNNTVVAPPRMLIAFLENNYSKEGIKIPKVLRPYMGGLDIIKFDK